MGRTELVDPLTDREREILALLAQRLTDKEIAQALVISPMTVKRHASTIYNKLQVNRRREAVAEAIRLARCKATTSSITPSIHPFLHPLNTSFWG